MFQQKWVLDDELMYLIGPMQELNYPVYLFTQPDLRRVPLHKCVFRILREQTRTDSNRS